MAHAKYLVLYIPGLGDHYDNGRSLALIGWRMWGVTARLVPIKWYEQGSYEQKLQRVKDAARQGLKEGYRVSLVGESAGASLALNAAAELPHIHKVIVIAGVNSSELPISPRYNTIAPAFVGSARRVSDALKIIDSNKIHTVRALWDPVVSPRFNDIPRAKTHVIVSFGHLPTIVLCLTVLSGFIVRLATSK